jgi:hypothetical protein
MTDRIALAARVRTVEPTSVCWAPSSNASAPMCGGPVTWVADGASWRSSCSRCNATGRAASGDAADLRRLFGRSAAECQEGGS